MQLVGWIGHTVLNNNGFSPGIRPVASDPLGQHYVHAVRKRKESKKNLRNITSGLICIITGCRHSCNCSIKLCNIEKTLALSCLSLILLFAYWYVCFWCNVIISNLAVNASVISTINDIFNHFPHHKYLPPLPLFRLPALILTYSVRHNEKKDLWKDSFSSHPETCVQSQP